MASRREFVAAAVLLAAGWRASAHGQPRSDRLPHVVFVSRGPITSNGHAFGEGLQAAGWVSGKNVRYEVRALPPDTEDYAPAAEALVREKVDLVSAAGAVVRPLYSALRGRIPMAYAFSGDPVEAGLAKSLSRPGTNASGVCMLALELVGKRLEVLKEVMPALRRVGVLANPNHPGERAEFEASSKAAARLGLEVTHFEVRTPPDIARAFETVRARKIEALDLFPDALTIAQAGKVAEFCLAQRIPSISGWNVFAQAGNVFSYGPNLAQAFRQTAGFADRMLRGASPASMPVEYPTRVEFVVNQRSARAIGLALPQSVLLRADEVIE
jgi:putative ABC transport system substrate-binding protein